jgi:hypothetical protein
MTADQLLQEAIINLQKKDVSAETRRLVDEAAQLLADGRDIEARALIEKAQALAVADYPSRVSSPAKGSGPMAGERMANAAISRIASRLAQSITSALAEAVEDLHISFGAQVTEVVSSLENRLAGITSQLNAVSGLLERVERIEAAATTNASASEERWERLSASVLSLQEADRDRQVEAEQFRGDVSSELERIGLRLTAQEEGLEAVNRIVSDLSLKVLFFAEQIDRHTGLLRSLHEQQAQRAAALNAVLDGFAQLREPKPLANEAGAA